MGKHILQIPADDGCVYLYDVETQELRKLCEIETVCSIPEEVGKTLEMAHLHFKIRGGDNG
jgi:hypothetical protein